MTLLNFPSLHIPQKHFAQYQYCNNRNMSSESVIIFVQNFQYNYTCVCIKIFPGRFAPAIHEKKNFKRFTPVYLSEEQVSQKRIHWPSFFVRYPLPLRHQRVIYSLYFFRSPSSQSVLETKKNSSPCFGFTFFFNFPMHLSDAKNSIFIIFQSNTPKHIINIQYLYRMKCVQKT